MNKIGAMTNHPPSMLYDVRHRLPTEVDFLEWCDCARGRAVGVPAPLHTAIYRLSKGKKHHGHSRMRTRQVVAHGKGAQLGFYGLADR